MIAGDEVIEGMTRSTAVPAGAVAYIDAEWISDESPELFGALIVRPGRDVRWRNGNPLPASHDDPDEVALLALLSFATEAAILARSAGGPAEVTGSGIVAWLIRRLIEGSIDSSAVLEAAQPPTIVDTTGEPEVVAASLERIEDLGTLVLAGEPRKGTFPLDVYPNLHVRGLSVVGVSRPLSGDVLPPSDALASVMSVEDFRSGLATRRPDATETRAAMCYRVEGRSTAAP